MIIECDSCEVRGHACGDCVIGVLLGTPVPSGAPIVQLDAPEQRAFDVLAEQGLVLRLRLVAPRPSPVSTKENGGRPIRDAG
jgi:hypothetical protein